MSRMTNLLTAAERAAVRGAANAGPMSSRLSGINRVAGARRINMLRVVPGFRREGHIETSPARPRASELSNVYRSLTLPTQPTCRGCGQPLEPGGPIIEFSFWANADSRYGPQDAYLHDGRCPSPAS